MTERAYPPGHPASEDFDPDSPEAKAWATHYKKTAAERDFPPGHPAASDTPAEKKGNGYQAKYVSDEASLKHGCLTLRAKDVLIAADPLAASRQMVSLVGRAFDKKALTLEGEVKFPSGGTFALTQGIWTQI